MKLTIDANVLFSALIKNGVSRKLIFHADLDLNTPRFFLAELQKYRTMLIAKSNLDEKDFDILMATVLKQVDLIGEKEPRPYLPIAADPIDDEKDLLYVAAALHTGSAILSNDKDLQKQKRIKTYTTEQLVRELKIA